MSSRCEPGFQYLDTNRDTHRAPLSIHDCLEISGNAQRDAPSGSKTSQVGTFAAHARWGAASL